ncbi:translocation/assembly module TamB domain-containing protein [Sulfitobacter sp. HNIBRBA2951]|uniref:translocation/assembly module TamB domain-containing protein n=1 Tax=Sulfitobacter aquimarinus TaxID=3158557 RepID=UPI0032DFAD62
MRMIRLALAFVAVLFAVPAYAQEEDKGFLVSKIQELLSSAGRDVQIIGFRGALSSAASFDLLSIADDDGVWLTMEDVVLDWNRSALLRGRLEVEELSAARIDLPRLPVTEQDAPPSAEATPFTFPTLPDLPVSIDIQKLRIAQLDVGEPIVGEALRLQMTANAQLNSDGLVAEFVASRTDGKRGDFDLAAILSRDAGTLDLTLKLSEQENGIAATVLAIPNEPSVDLSVVANGPLDDLVFDLQIDTDGSERLAGEIAVKTTGDAANPDRRIVADIGGDITAVIAPEYRDFFGPDVGLKADALLAADGSVSVDQLDLQAAAVDLQGQVRLDADKWPAFIDIEGTVARADGKAVLLPGGEGDVALDRVTLNIDYDLDAGEAYEAQFDITDLTSAAASIAQTTLRSTGTLTGANGAIGQLRGAVQFGAQGVTLTDPALAEAVGTDVTGRADINYLTDQPFRISALALEGADYNLQGDLEFSGLGAGLQTTLDAVLNATDLSRFSALAGRELDGATSLTLKGSVTPLSGEFDLQAQGTAEGIKTGIAQADALLEGRTDVQMNAIRNVNGTFLRGLELSNAALLMTGEAQLATASSRVDADIVLRDIAVVLPQYEGRVELTGSAIGDTEGWRVNVDADGPYGANVKLDGLATGPDAELAFTAAVPQVQDFAPEVTGPLNAAGTLRQTPQGWMLQTDANGPYDATARINGLITPAVDINFDVSVPQVSRVVPQVSGPLRARGQLRVTDAGIVIDTTASGPYGARAKVAGLATGDNMALDFDVSVPNVAPLAPGVNGPLSANGTLRQTPEGLVVRTNAFGPYSTRASVNGVVTGADAGVAFTLNMPNLGALVPKVSGPLSLDGRADKTPAGWQINTSARGPSGTQAQIAGLARNDGTLDIGINGSAPLGLSAPFIAPRSLQGQARFDLRLDGPAGLEALSGTIQTTGATLTAPNLRVALEGINATVQMANSRATVDMTARASNGGDIAVNGTVGLSGAQQADIDIALRNVALIDPRLYRTSISGALGLRGPISGGAQISGGLTINETFVTVPSTGLTSIGDIPDITHVGASSANQRTRARAGLLDQGSAASDNVTSSGGGSGGFGLDILVDAPGRIFVRGRGLDAELGGRLRLTGTTDNIISTGRFELERGRLDILGKRFDLAEGSAQFQGDFVPYIRFVSTTSTDTGTASVIVEGPADAPEVTFESSPAGPQDEVLAQLLFGRNLSEISAFQALQLANAVATLAGRGGTGVVGNLRDRFGLDDLDVTTTDSGETALRVGKYLSDNVYTDVTAASDGTGEVSLNIDLTPNLTGRATLGSDGDSSIGIFFEKDY